MMTAIDSKPLTEAQAEALKATIAYMESCKTCEAKKPLFARYATEQEIIDTADYSDEELTILIRGTSMTIDWAMAVMMSRGYKVIPQVNYLGFVIR
jgi:hypothetical protein